MQQREEERNQRPTLQRVSMRASEVVSEVVSMVVDASVKVTTAVAEPSVIKLNKAIPKCTNLVEHDSRRTLKLRGHDHTIDLEQESIFNPAEKLNEEEGKRQLELPESMYGAAIMVVLNRPASNTRGGLCRLLFPVFFSLFVTTAIQIIFAVYLHRSVTSVAGDLHGTCDCSDALLRMLASMAFISFIVKDVIETFNMPRWLYLFQGRDHHEMITFVSLAYTVNASHSAASCERLSERHRAMSRSRSAANTPIRSPPNSPPASPGTDGGEDEASTDQHDCDAPGDAPGHEQRPDGETEVTMKRKLCRPLTGITKWERAACQPNWPRYA